MTTRTVGTQIDDRRWVHRAQDRKWKDFHSSDACQLFMGASLGGNLVSGAVLDPDWRAQKSERSANLVFEETLIGEVQLHFAVSEDDESRRPNRSNVCRQQTCRGRYHEVCGH